MNLSLEAISLITVFDISWSFLESSSLLKNSEAFFTDCRVTSTIFFLSPRKTFSASGRRRAPWHTGQGSSVQKCFVPRPLHAGHAPYGELKEKSRGSTSGKENPSYGHMNLLDMIRLLTDRKCFVPRPLHAGHAPYGELKEKSRGSTSGKENPSYGHMNLLDMIRLL